MVVKVEFKVPNVLQQTCSEQNYQEVMSPPCTRWNNENPPSQKEAKDAFHVTVCRTCCLRSLHEQSCPVKENKDEKLSSDYNYGT